MEDEDVRVGIAVLIRRNEPAEFDDVAVVRSGLDRDFVERVARATSVDVLRPLDRGCHAAAVGDAREGGGAIVVACPVLPNAVASRWWAGRWRCFASALRTIDVAEVAED